MKALHSIKIASKKSGLSPHLIRAWEKRYDAVVPERTETNRRVYSDEDIERLKLLRRVTEAGEHIGNVAELSNDDLSRLLASLSSVNISDKEDIIAAGDSIETPEDFINGCLKYVERYELAELEMKLLRASVVFSQRVFIEEVMAPFLKRIGEKWHDGSLRIAHEHLAASAARTILGGMLSTYEKDESAPGLISTTPAGTLHEIGALMVAVTAASEGWRSFYFGANMPAMDIASAAISNNAKVIALSIIYPPDDPNIARQMERLSAAVNGQIEILVGGDSAGGYKSTIEKVNAIHLRDLGQLREALSSIRSKGI
ncbi:MAG: MerR family transcriptional regulator [candidate division Zixibacteria bacterium]|nr:MerR family transcriptional regulator [candidate division Zixibacteria bacterium]